MKKFSLHKRLILAVVASQLLLACGLAIVGTSFSLHYIRHAFDVYLEGRAESVAALVYYPDDGSPGLLFNDQKIPSSPRRSPQELFLVASDRGGFERHTAGFDPRGFDAIPPHARFWNLQVDGHAYHAIVLRDVPILDTEEGVPLPLPKLKVIYAAPTAEIEQQIARLAIQIGVVSLLILVPTLLLGLWSIRRALAPLHDLTEAAGSISVECWKFEPSQRALATKEFAPLIGATTTVLSKLEDAYTRQRVFLGNAAHELKTSLAILKSSLQTLLTRDREPMEYQTGLQMMNRDCERLERLLNRMLQTARAEQRIVESKQQAPPPVDLASSCESAIAQLAQFASLRGIQIHLEAEGDPLIRAELADLELIWINLLENAIQYSPKGATVTMRLSLHGDRVTVAVIDQGCGIQAEHLPFIFERFYRVDSSRSRATGGFGLGLAITKSLVDLYHGSIAIESMPGKGTSIRVDFPIASALKLPVAVDHCSPGSKAR